MDISHTTSFVQKHNNRIKKQLQKLADLPKHFNCHQIQHPHFKVFEITINVQTLTFLKIQDLNRHEPIKFEVILTDEYPFLMPQIVCITSIPLAVDINDRRNLVNDILGCAWGPAVIIRDVIEKIPEFLRVVYGNRNSRGYLHGLGMYVEGGVYYREDLERSVLKCFECEEIVANSIVIIITTEKKSLLALSGTFLLVFEANLAKNYYLFTDSYRLNESSNAAIELGNEKVQLDFGSKRMFQIKPVSKHKQFCLLFSHIRQSALAKEEMVGSVTGLQKNMIEKQIARLEKEIGELKEGEERGKFEELKRCLSDIIEIEAVEAEEKVEGYKKRLHELFENENYLAKE